MPTRTAQRRKGKQLTWAEDLDGPGRRAAIRWHLRRWRAEAWRRADDLGEPAVWAFEHSVRRFALALDPSGDLAADLSRACAEAVAACCGPHMVRGSRPPADRARVGHVPAEARSPR